MATELKPRYASQSRYWFDGDAPERELLFAKAQDPANGETYRLPFRVYRQGAHYYNAKTNNPLSIKIVMWSKTGAHE